MTIKEPESEEDRLMVEEIKRKKRDGKEHTFSEMSFVVKHMEYFIDSEEFEKINREAEEYGKILEKSCIRVKNPRVWAR